MRCLWAIVLTAAICAATEVAPRDGGLNAFDAKGQARGACPLEHTDVKAEISGWVSQVTVTQRYGNPFTDRIEAVYTFPLPHDGAVCDYELKVGQRRIYGQIKKREEAERIYEQARAQGKTAALLNQERPNIFTQSVANIRPGETVEVKLRYTATLPLKDGVFRFVLPLVVGPRYMPGAPTGHAGTGWSPDTTGVPDASKISPPVTPPGTRAGHDVGISVRLAPGLPLQEVRSPSHAVDIVGQPWGAEVKLRNAAEIPNKDFILEYTAATATIGDAVLSFADAGPGHGGYFAVMLQPPARVAPKEAVPKEIVFVLDTSGSMSGLPIETAKRAMHACLAQLNPSDTFNFITFSGDTAILFDHPVAPTPDNLAKATAFLESRQGGGGTEMMKAIRAALDPSDQAGPVRVVCFMTDGFVGNDREIIAEVGKHANARVFSFGIGSSVNRYLLDGMARAGRGEVEYVPMQGSDQATAAMKAEEAGTRFAERVRTPVLTDIKLDWGHLPVADLQPERVPDLFAAKPILVVGRFKQAARGTLTLRGRTSAGDFEHKLPVDLPEQSSDNEVLPQLWARAKVEELSLAEPVNPKPEAKAQITALGLEYRLMTAFTSFVAVEETTVTEGGAPRKVVVPVEMPEGVSYEGVFGGGGGPGTTGIGGMLLGIGAISSLVRADASAPWLRSAPPATGPAAPPPALKWLAGRVGFGLRGPELGNETAKLVVSLDVTDTKLATVLDLLKQQVPFEYAMAPGVDGNEPITLAFKNVPFANALNAVLGSPFLYAVEVVQDVCIIRPAGAPGTRADAKPWLAVMLKGGASVLGELATAPGKVSLGLAFTGEPAALRAELTELGATVVEQGSDATHVTVSAYPEQVRQIAAIEAIHRIQIVH